jgi:cell division protein ZapB
MATLDDLAERIERLVLRHEELERTNSLLVKQLDAVTGERDSMKSRLTAARSRLDTLLERLPADGAVGASKGKDPAIAADLDAHKP